MPSIRISRARRLIALLSATLLCGVVVASAAERRPNVIVILTDDQGYADVGCFGAKGYTTPHLDSLARDGVKFTNFHAAQPVCSASRASLLTGCYANRVGIHDALFPHVDYGLSPTETTLAKILHARGYATGMAGKWHLGDAEAFLPNHHGFDEFFILPYSHDMSPYNPAAKPGTHPKLPLIEDGRVINGDVTPSDMAQLTTWYTERALRFIERNRARPFFFYLAHSMPHVPLAVSEKFKDRSGAGLYGDVIMELDWSVGQILAKLHELGLERDTLVIFTSDNGPWLAFGDHAGSAGPLREGKSTSWEGGTRVPALMRWPGHLPAGVTNDHFMVAIDLLPTIAARVGAELGPLPIDGRDIWPLLANASGATNPHEGYGFWYAQNELQAVVSGDGRWKLVFPHRFISLAGRAPGHGGLPARYSLLRVERAALYDLVADVGETTDVSAAHPEVMARLQAFAEKCRAELGDKLTQHPSGTGTRAAGRIATPATAK